MGCLINVSVSSLLLYCDSNGLLLKSDRCNSGCQTRSYSHLLRPHVSTGMLCYFCWPLLQLHLLMFTITVNLSQFVLAVFPATHKKNCHLINWKTTSHCQQSLYFNFFTATLFSFPLTVNCVDVLTKKVLLGKKPWKIFRFYVIMWV